jgi:hypothetical protein
MFARVSKCGLQNIFGFEKTLVALMVTWIDDVASGVSIALSLFHELNKDEKRATRVSSSTTRQVQICDYNEHWIRPETA